MKRKLLLFSVLFGLYVPAEAQVLQSDNFNSLTVGNIGTDFTGTTAGQGGYYTVSSNGSGTTTTTNSGNANFQIVAAGGSNLNVFSFQGPNGDQGGRLMWKNGLPAAWTARTSGNNILELEVDINPGARGTSRNDFGINVYDAAYSKILVGVKVDAGTGELYLMAYSVPPGAPVGTPANNYTYSLAAAPGIQLPANQFSRVGVSFNMTTGAVKIKGPGLPAAGAGLTGSAIGIAPAEADFESAAGVGPQPGLAPNTVAATVTMDNFVVRASATDTLLGTEAFSSVESSKFTVYPNPVNDIVKISNGENLQINKVAITDINGRTVKTLDFNGVTETQINVSDLNSGIYFMSIDTNEGTATQKIIKN
ncbi:MULTISPECIES: T9SS type A sorting domain-containing protein [Flavobacterium]|uniref:T9SS type A sorting domain-containing protein n=1 Tax=Flavobacterium TaxID=237 RepID=UPI001FCBFD37|nr:MULTISPECIES: T9SS type A sorting domain-containing protein [Flavobacterium]UOK41675.1 T9SS type A sorting domain-containing protein [Flavobacterium enshiense]